jgi:hypothetical protein
MPLLLRLLVHCGIFAQPLHDYSPIPQCIGSSPAGGKLCRHVSAPQTPKPPRNLGSQRGYNRPGTPRRGERYMWGRHRRLQPRYTAIARRAEKLGNHPLT